jgi:transcriptional regulator with XRE-family HTH domain
MKTIADLGGELQQLRGTAGMSQEAMASAVGMRQEAVSRFERGRGNDFSVAKLLRMLHALGYDVSFVRAGGRPTLEDVRREVEASENTGPNAR